ncbi:hypothetical protein ACP70R_039966 [Stipagrostis hirtigluma subsp. patula]
MLPSSGGRRLVPLFRRAAAAAAAAAGGTNPFHPRPHAESFSNRWYLSTPPARTLDAAPCRTTASYLVASCGVSPAAAAAASRRIRIISTAKADAVLAILRRYGFSDAHIARMLRNAPQLLLADPDKVVRPKLQFFASLGIPAVILAGTTRLLFCSLHNHLIPCVEFLRGILRTDADIRTAVSSNPYGFVPDLDKNMRPAVEALRRHGLSEEAISELLLLNLRVLWYTPHRIAGIFEDLQSLGLPITDTRFLRCFAVMCNLRRETIWRRLALYQSLGLSKCQVAKAFLTQPKLLGLAEENIQRKLLFFRDELKIALSQLIARPHVFTFSMEKNILPKCAVLSILMRSGKIQRDINLLGSLALSTKQFTEKYVKKYEKDVPDVVGAYEGKTKFSGFMDKDFEVR